MVADAWKTCISVSTALLLGAHSGHARGLADGRRRLSEATETLGSSGVLVAGPEAALGPGGEAASVGGMPNTAEAPPPVTEDAAVTVVVAPVAAAPAEPLTDELAGTRPCNTSSHCCMHDPHGVPPCWPVA